MPFRAALSNSAASYLKPGELVHAVISAEAARQPLASLSGVFVFFSFNAIGSRCSKRARPAWASAAHRAHRHFFKDIEIADTFTAAA